MGGELKGLLLARDGNNNLPDTGNSRHLVDYKGIPYWMAKLDTFARGIARAFNLGQDVDGNCLYNDDKAHGHFNAFNLNGNDGYNFFVPRMADGTVYDNMEGNPLMYNLITARNFSVSQALLEDPRKLAAAKSLNGNVVDISDNSYLLELLELKHNPFIFNEGKFGNFIESIIGELGIVASEAIAFEGNYRDIQAAVQNQRLSVSSVDLDEEVANLILFQQMYNAAAKLIAVLNGIYDTTINRMG
jgi:flagellar hook-associated protein 1 FlgK